MDIYYIHYIHKRHSIARQLGRGMGCFLWCGMKLRIHLETSMAQPWEFGIGQIISYATLLDMWSLIHAGIKVTPFSAAHHTDKI